MGASLPDEEAADHFHSEGADTECLQSRLTDMGGGVRQDREAVMVGRVLLLFVIVRNVTRLIFVHNLCT